MKTLLTVNLTTKTTTWTPPKWTFGEEIVLALRFEQDVAGETIEPDLEITGLTAAVGNVDARPESGTWTLQIGPDPATADNTTAELQHDCTAAALKAAINALPDVVTDFGSAVVRKEDGSWIIVFGTGADEVELTVRDNRLFPISLGRTGRLEVDAQWHHEIRLVQMPVAFSEDSERVLPDAPSITVVRAGGSSGDFEWNEVQALYVPPDFRGSYALQFGFARTARLTPADGVEQIQAALIAALGAEDVTVENGGIGEAIITFVGDLAGTDVTAITVEALDPPPGDLTFTLALTKAELHAMLRRSPEVTLPLEVRILVEDDEAVVTEHVAFRTDVTIQRCVLFPELATVPVIDWLRVPSPVDYIPRSSSVVFTGDKSEAFVVGDGVADVFTLAHSLATDDVEVWARENISGGLQLVHGTDFAVAIDSSSQVSVQALLTVPTTNEWTIYIRAAEPVAAFAPGLTLTIAEITGLEARLAAIEESVADLLTLTASEPLGTATASGTSITIPIEGVEGAFPGVAVTGATVNLAALPTRPKGLLPACHDASLGTIATTLEALSPSAGDVFTNDTGAALLIPGGMGVRSSYIEEGEFAAWDGRRWYPVTRRGSTNSYFPRDYERELFMFEVNKEMLRAGMKLALTVPLSLRLYNANGRVACRFVIEHGVTPRSGSPMATAIDITDTGTGTHTMTRDGETVGTFTVNAGTDVVTVTLTSPATMPVDGDVVQVSSATTLPGGLAAATDYAVRDVSGATLKLAAFTNAENLRDVEWNATPLVSQAITIGATAVPHKIGVEVLRSASGVLSANKIRYDYATAADSIPISPDLALRGRLIDFDTENSVADAAGTIFYKLTATEAKIS